MIYEICRLGGFGAIITKIMQYNYCSEQESYNDEYHLSPMNCMVLTTTGFFLNFITTSAGRIA